MPVPGYAEWALPHAWWNLDRSSKRKQERLEARLLFRRWTAPTPGRPVLIEGSKEYRLLLVRDETKKAAPGGFCI
jgi:hypothetical protein